MKQKNAFLITITGLVQGVGFRPFIFLLAKKHNLYGWVKNTNQDVIIYIQGNIDDHKYLINEIKSNAPQSAIINEISIKKTINEGLRSFKIKESTESSNAVTLVSPDIAVCNSCLTDLKTQQHRINYPLTNCTHCGPRFTIIKNLPYDRKNTTMAEFDMCKTCNEEYINISNRRFHAQPVSCNQCGPEYLFINQNERINDINTILSKSSVLIDNGSILTVKGIGGYHFVCDAKNNNTVKKLRKIKNRESKPFAVLFKDSNTIEKYAILNLQEKKLIESWHRPIVLLKLKNNKLVAEVSNGMNHVGAFLPYMPFHYLLFEKLKTDAIVLTSGNFSNEPIVIDDKIAKKLFLPVVKGIISYNRDIHNRTDDSVAMIINKKVKIIRRSRGYTPLPVNLNFDAEGILAVGAELENTFCIGKKKQAIISQHIGDLQNYQTYNFFTESIKKYMQLFRFKPKIVVCDMHPDYLSSGYAEQTKLPVIKVQHHHAHIVSCMAVHNIKEGVIGFSFDGTGLGDDGKIWGGEIMICDYLNYKRLVHLEYMPLPGGDAAIKEPWRIAVSYLYKSFGSKFLSFDLPFLKKIDPLKITMLTEMIEKNINCIYTSSMGRLFDAVSAILNICLYADFHAEAPMRLENIVIENYDSLYQTDIKNIIDVRGIIVQIINDIKDNVKIEEISTKFHNTIVDIISKLSNELRQEYEISKIILCGGVFLNKYICTKTERMLESEGFEVYSSGTVPVNDGGISLGQLAIAAHILKKKNEFNI